MLQDPPPQKTIIVPIDFSVHALAALDNALYIAKAAGASIKLVFVNKQKSIASLFQSRSVDMDEVVKSFEALLASLGHHGIQMEYIVRQGHVAREITALAEELNAWMIVMGTHGTSGFQELWAGSNAYRVVSASESPVITMRGNNGDFRIKNIALPLDCTPATLKKVAFTAELAALFNATIHIAGLCLDDEEEANIKVTGMCAKVARDLEERKIQYQHTMLFGSNAASLTIHFAQQTEADLISITTEQESSILSSLLGPYAQQMVNHSPIPILSLSSVEGNPPSR